MRKRAATPFVSAGANLSILRKEPQQADRRRHAGATTPRSILIANAGISGGRGRGHGIESAEQTEAIPAVNRLPPPMQADRAARIIRRDRPL